MPYNTSAIPPRKEPTGQTQLPLSRVKKIIAQDQDINLCSNNAAFVITVATELFIQKLAEDCLKEAKLERKPRRNIQYKDVANAVNHKDSLEFLEDIVPRTVRYKDIKKDAAATRASLRGDKSLGGDSEADRPVPNGKKHKPSGSRSSLNGTADIADLLGGGGAGAKPSPTDEEGAEDPNDQLEAEMRQARGDDDVEMTG